MEDEQKLTEQQRTALSQLEDLRSELHSMVDARVDGSIHSILTGRVLEQALPTLPLTANPSVFKGEKPESILFPDGREVKTPTWKTARQGFRAAARDSRGFAGEDARAAGN